jgi:hypothetical protein
MAMMMPSDIGEFETEGEKSFYKFLEGVAKPDAHCLCWYLPEVNGNEPDFLLYCEEVGVENYRVLLSKLEAENHGKVAEPGAPYFVSRAEKVTQRRLFD